MKRVLLYLLFYLISDIVYGQCPSVPAAPSVPGTCTDLCLSSGSDISGGTTNQLCTCTSIARGNVNGGTIYVASGQTLSVNSVQNSPTIYVMAGGILNVSGTLGGGTIYVYGTLNLSGNAIQNSVTIYVASTGIFNATNSGLDFTAGSLVVEGTANFANIAQFQNGPPSPSVCYNNSGCTKISAISLGETGGFIPSNSGYMYWPNTTCPTIVNGHTFTSSSSITICTGQTNPSNNPTSTQCPFWGSATMLWGCTSTNGTCTGAFTSLPIVLVYFEAEKSNEGVILTWQATQQINSNYFIIDKSQNGLDWQQVGTLPSRNGQATYQEYSITDNTPYTGVSYYRLVEVDINGTQTTYGVDYVDISSSSSSGFTMYPNPTTGDLNVNILGGETALSYDFELVDVTGKSIIKTTLLSGINRLGNIATSSGMYFAKLKVGPNVLTQKLVVQ